MVINDIVDLAKKRQDQLMFLIRHFQTPKGNIITEALMGYEQLKKKDKL